MKVKVYGKVNLALKIVGVENSMHVLDMVTASINIFDVLTLTESTETSCNLTEIIQEHKNTAYIASELFSEKYNTPKVAIQIEKGIPLMAGMGGSSADAAAVLCGMQRMFKVDDSTGIMALAHKIGSDVPLLMSGGFNRVGGTGELVEKIETNLQFGLLIANNSQGVSASEAYKMYDRLAVTNGNDVVNAVDAMVVALVENDAKKAISLMVNDLGESAIAIDGEVGNTIDYLSKFVAGKSIVCGSGSACCRIFDGYDCVAGLDLIHCGEVSYLKAVGTVGHGIEFLD